MLARMVWGTFLGKNLLDFRGSLDRLLYLHKGTQYLPLTQAKVTLDPDLDE